MAAEPLTENDLRRRSELWHEAAPVHFDGRVAWWVKAILVAAACVAAIYFVDFPVASWSIAAHPIDEKGAWHFKNDIVRELGMLEQWGQWVCSVIVIGAVAMIDRAGPRRALAIAIGCFATVMATYLLKDLCGRNRPYVDLMKEMGLAVPAGSWVWGGPKRGFGGGSKWGSFPSAHTTGAFALSVGLAWFYPRGRALFMTLATITAVQRVLHSAHYVSDVVGGMGIAVIMTRWTFQARLAGKVIAVLPASVRTWLLRDVRS